MIHPLASPQPLSTTVPLPPPLPDPGTRTTTVDTLTRQTPQGTEQVRVVTTERVGFWEESPNVFSSMRLLCFISLMAAIVFGLLAVLGIGSAAGVTLAMAFLAAAMAGKVVQRAIEPK